MKQRVCMLLLLAFICCFTGCAGQESGRMEDTSSDQGTSVSKWEKNNAGIQNMLSPMLIGDVLYYWNGTWDQDSMRWSGTSIYRKKCGDDEAEEVVALGEKELIYFLADEKHNLYFLYAEYVNDGKNFFFRKVAGEGDGGYDIPLSASQEELKRIKEIAREGYITQGAVSGQGEVCLYGNDGELYFFGGLGQFLGIYDDDQDGKAGQDGERGLVNAGKEGIFSYIAKGNKIRLQEINMAQASLGKTTEIEIDSEASLEIYSGYDRGILISDSSVLWEYHLLKNKITKLFDWGEENINLNGYEISRIGLMENGGLCALAYRSGSLITELVQIEARDATKVKEKQVIELGMREYYSSEEASELEIMAESFNKYNQEYRIEIRTYPSAGDFYNDLLKGNGPDVFELGASQQNVLAEKGILEDLAPFFGESHKVKEADLLPSVRNAGYIDGKFVRLFPKFSLSGYLVERGTTENGGWRPGEFIGLGESYPDALLSPIADPSNLLQSALYGDMESYINWQDKECSFDSERFVSLLKGVNQVSKADQSADIIESRQNACQWLSEKEILTNKFWIGSVFLYLEYKEAYGDFAEFAGYPNESGKPFYRMETDYMLGMNSASKVKDGVWAFLEYLLSKEYQSEITGAFPVRRDAFDSCIAARDLELRAGKKPEGGYVNSFSFVKNDSFPGITDEDREFIRYMTDHAYFDDSLSGMVILKIILEEAGAYFSGDKSPGEAADIIQNRISLFLKE